MYIMLLSKAAALSPQSVVSGHFEPEAHYPSLPAAEVGCELG